MKTYTNFEDHALKVNTDDYNILVIIDPSGTPIRLALDTVTYDGNSYKALITKISNLTLSTDSDLQNLINKQKLTIELVTEAVADAGLEYQDLLTGALLNTDVDIYIILGAAQDGYKIGSFNLYDYELKYGKLLLKLNVAEQQAYDDVIIEQDGILNFGNFGWGYSSDKEAIWTYMGWFYHNNRLARAIKTSYSDDRVVYKLCDKEMNELPDNGTEAAYSFYSYIYSSLYERGFWVNIDFNDFTNITVTNDSANGCIFEFDQSGASNDLFDNIGYNGILASPQSYDRSASYGEGSQLLLDGKNTTSEALENSGTRATFCYYFSVDDIKAVRDAVGQSGSDIDAFGDALLLTSRIAIDFGVIASGAGNEVLIEVRLQSDDSLLDSLTYDDSYSDKSVEFYLASIPVSPVYSIQEVYFVLRKNGSGGTEPYVKNIKAMLKPSAATDWNNFKVSNIDNLYVRCKGIEYDDNWNSRVTVGNLIERPVHMLEYLARYYIEESDIDMDAFDDINDIATFDTTLTLVGRHTLSNIIQKFSQTFGINLLHRLEAADTFYPILYNDEIDYPNSGTSSPDDEDTFADELTISDDEFTENPILKDSVKITLKPGYGVVTYNYSKLDSDLFIDATASGAGLEKIVNTDFFSSDEEFKDADTDLDLLDRYVEEKRIIELTTFINAFIFEPGDALSFEHTALLAHFDLTQLKGVVFSWVFDFMKKLITLKLAEIDNTSV